MASKRVCSSAASCALEQEVLLMHCKALLKAGLAEGGF